jgi:hypothetical protein
VAGLHFPRADGPDPWRVDSRSFINCNDLLRIDALLHFGLDLRGHIVAHRGHEKALIYVVAVRNLMIHEAVLHAVMAAHELPVPHSVAEDLDDDLALHVGGDAFSSLQCPSYPVNTARF